MAYVRADQDGDGVSELLRVVYAHAGGTAGRIIERVEWDGPVSIVLASPLLMSHTIVGRSNRTTFARAWPYRLRPIPVIYA